MIKMASAAGAVFPMTVKDLLLQGLDTRDRFLDGLISKHGLAVATGLLEARLERLLERPYRLPENKRLAKHLCHEFDYLFTYLKHPRAGSDQLARRASDSSRSGDTKGLGRQSK